MSQPGLADVALVWGWWGPSGVDADGELVGVGVQRCQQRDVVVLGAAGAAPGRRLLDPAGEFAAAARRPRLGKERGELVFAIGDAGPGVSCRALDSAVGRKAPE